MIFQKNIKESTNINNAFKISFFKSNRFRFSYLLENKISLKKILSLFFLTILCFHFSIGQIQRELEDRRRKLLKEIDLTSDLLNKTTKSKVAALDRYVTLRSQVQKRELLVETLRKEIEFTNLSIKRTTEVVKALTKDIERLEKEYGELLRQAYRRKKNNSDLGFIFSAESLNQGFQRWQYLKQYDEYRKKQAQLIQETKESLTFKKEQLEETKLEKVQLIDASEQQAALLSSELGDKSKLLSTLKKDEKRLKSELRQQRENHESLNLAIESAIKKDMVVRRKNERKPTPNKNNDAVNKKPKAKEQPSTLNRLTGNFRGNRGRLPMPVEKGVVTKRFGKQPHPTLPKIEITNNGIDIRTERNAKVFTIFEGKVVSKQFIPGYQNMLIIQHGEYYTVYSNLEEVYVEKGDQVATLQNLGTVAVDRKSNVAEVHFEVWRDKVRLNPEDWLK